MADPEITGRKPTTTDLANLVHEKLEHNLPYVRTLLRTDHLIMPVKFEPVVLRTVADEDAFKLGSMRAALKVHKDDFMRPPAERGQYSEPVDDAVEIVFGWLRRMREFPEVGIFTDKANISFSPYNGRDAINNDDQGPGPRNGLTLWKKYRPREGRALVTIPPLIQLVKTAVPQRTKFAHIKAPEAVPDIE